MTLSNKLFPWRIFYRFVLVQVVLVLTALLSSGLLARYFFKQYYLDQVRTRVKDTLNLLVHSGVQEFSPSWCTNNLRGSEIQLLVLRNDGTVVCNSGYSLNTDKVSEFSEIREAFSAGYGEDIRIIEQAKGEAFLGAVQVPDRAVVIRGTVSLANLSAAMTLFDTSLFVVLAVLACFLGIIGVWQVRKLVFPLGRLIVKTQSVLSRQPETPTKEELFQEPFGEWSDLETNIDHIRQSLESTHQTLSREQVELDTVMAAISDAILSVDTDGKPLFFNSRFEVVFGGGKLRQGSVRLWELFRDPEILEAFRGALKKGQASGAKAVPWEQGKRFFSLSVSPLRKQDGSVYGALGIFHDVTELKSAEQMRIDFVANVSHELRTPLTAIKGYTETLLSDLNEANANQSNREFLEIISRNCNRLMAIMEDLLDLSALESSEILQKDSLDTAEVTGRIIKQLGPAFEAKRQKVAFKIRAPTVLADSNRLEQVLTNLLDNANKYTPPGGTIQVDWEMKDKDVLLRVSDTGPGIPLEHQSRLFERFYRVDKARSRERGGTGLGLAIVKHTMQRHEGAVWVESAPGQGSTFVCQFPH